MVALLRNRGVRVLILESRKDAVTPDAVFPNNWFSHHGGETLVLYPMLAENRRLERQPEQLKTLLSGAAIHTAQILDLSRDEHDGLYLEGTGSLVLDRVNKTAFAMESPRTSREEFGKWCGMMRYEGVFFHTSHGSGVPIYHTNIVMSLGREFAVVCLESVSNPEERSVLERKLQLSKREIISISVEQMNSYCGNILQLISRDGNSLIVMSRSAYNNYRSSQQDALKKYGQLVIVDIPTIERVGGGSARCMMSEIFPVDSIN